MTERHSHTKTELQAAQSRESVKQRAEREHGELMEELRALIPGAEVLFGLLIAIRFTAEFRELGEVQRYVYYAALAFTAIALVLFIAPAAHHRIGFREGDKDYVVRKGNREAIVGSVALALAFTAALYLVGDLLFGTVAAGLTSGALFGVITWRWWALALRRNALSPASGASEADESNQAPPSFAAGRRETQRPLASGPRD